MSITFTAKALDGQALTAGSVIEPCLCTQEGDAFMEAMDLDSATAVYPAELLARLATDARFGCATCKGCGVETYTETVSINFANDSAAALLRACGLPSNGQACPVALRALLAPLTRANARLGIGDGRQPGYYLEAGGRFHGGTLTADGLAERVQRFMDFLDGAIAGGASSIGWE